MNQARGSYQFKTFSIIYGLENAVARDRHNREILNTRPSHIRNCRMTQIMKMKSFNSRTTTRPIKRGLN